MQKKMNDMSGRRKMIKRSAMAAGVFMIVPRHVLGRGYLAPSDKLNLAAVGAGGKGKSDIRNAWNKGRNNVVALCDVDAGQSKESRDKFSKAKYYADFRKMLDEMHGDIDAITVSTPDHTHAVIALAAMSLGKHVYVQKPLTHDIYEARMLTLAARENKVVTQMGNQGASNPGQQQMVKWFLDGVVGSIHAVDVWTNRPVWPQGIPVPQEKIGLPETMTKENWDLFIGPSAMVDYHPLYHPFKWRGWWNFGTGALGDMGCHLIDTPFRVLQLGYPEEVECSVGQVFTKDWVPEYIPEGCPPSARVQLRFPQSDHNLSSVKMTWHDGGLRPFHPDLIPADDFLGETNSTNGVIMIGAKGIITCGTYGRDPKVYLKSGEVLTMPEKKGGDADLPEYGHQVSWTEACKEGFGGQKHRSLTSSFDYSGPLTETVLMGNLAIRSATLGVKTKDKRGNLAFPGRKKLSWNGETMQITNFAEANQFVKRQYRSGWEMT